MEEFVTPCKGAALSVISLDASAASQATLTAKNDFVSKEIQTAGHMIGADRVHNV